MMFKLMQGTDNKDQIIDDVLKVLYWRTVWQTYTVLS